MAEIIIKRYLFIFSKNIYLKLKSGKIVKPINGGWYDGQQYYYGTLSKPGEIHPLLKNKE